MQFEKILPVPYFVQPTAITCQSTCLKMMATYLERQVLHMSTGAEAIEIEQIWQEVNHAPGRPSALRNAHVNFEWWLQRRFKGLRFVRKQFANEADVAEAVTRSIDRGMPALVSVSHERVKGHIVLVIGYQGYQPGLSSEAFKLVVHDPYGRFDPSLGSKASRDYGKGRYLGGASLQSGSQTGPGQSVALTIDAIARRRSGDSGHFLLLLPER